MNIINDDIRILCKGRFISTVVGLLTTRTRVVVVIVCSNSSRTLLLIKSGRVVIFISFTLFILLLLLAIIINSATTHTFITTINMNMQNGKLTSIITVGRVGTNHNLVVVIVIVVVQQHHTFLLLLLVFRIGIVVITHNSNSCATANTKMTHVSFTTELLTILADVTILTTAIAAQSLGHREVVGVGVDGVGG